LKFIVSFLSGLFPKGLPLPDCVFGECALPSDQPGDISLKQNTGLKPGEIAGISLVSIFFGICGLLVLWSAVYQYHARNQDPPPTKKGATITFENISYTIPSGRTVIRDVNGTAPAGEVLAIMGPSGNFAKHLSAKP
jgi:ABC-type multidrug transport system fused ATPase/permease subunit